jgi:DNA-binding FadR family transcriptional regulator
MRLTQGSVTQARSSAAPCRDTIRQGKPRFRIRAMPRRPRAAGALAAEAADADAIARIAAGCERMAAAEVGDDDALEADIAFHIAILEASRNPFSAQLRDVVSTALRTSIRFTNRFKGRSASLPHHHVVLAAI